MQKTKILSLLLVGCLCFGGLVGCSDDTTDTNTNTESSSSSNESTNKDEKTIYSQDVKIINNTGVEIKEMYISASDKDDWEENVLGVDAFASGSSLDIKFKEEEKAQYWDLMVKDSEGTSITWKKLDLFSISEITLNFDSSTGEATATYK